MLSAVQCLNSFAVTYQQRFIDNDTIADGYSNSGAISYYSYITGDNLYNRDARLTYSNSSSNNYSWCFGTHNIRDWVSTERKVKLKVYLNDARFTDPHASYCVEHGSFGNSAFIGELNQNTAPSGWSVLNQTIRSEGAAGGFLLQAVHLNPYGYSQYGTGADAINFLLENLS